MSHSFVTEIAKIRRALDALYEALSEEQLANLELKVDSETLGISRVTADADDALQSIDDALDGEGAVASAAADTLIDLGFMPTSHVPFGPLRNLHDLVF